MHVAGQSSVGSGVMALALIITLMALGVRARKETAEVHESMVDLLGEEGTAWTASVSFTDGPEVVDKVPWQLLGVAHVETQLSENAVTLYMPSADTAGVLIFRSLFCEEYSRLRGHEDAHGRCFFQAAPLDDGTDVDGDVYFTYTVTGMGKGKGIDTPVGTSGSAHRSKAALLQEHVNTQTQEDPSSTGHLGWVHVEEITTGVAGGTKELVLRFVFDEKNSISWVPAAVRLVGITREGRTIKSRLETLKRAAASTSFTRRWCYPVVIIMVLYGILYIFAEVVAARRRARARAVAKPHA